MRALGMVMRSRSRCAPPFDMTRLTRRCASAGDGDDAARTVARRVVMTRCRDAVRYPLAQGRDGLNVPDATATRCLVSSDDKLTVQ